MSTSDMNNVSIIGRLVRKPDLKYTATGSPVAQFDIANNSVYYTKDKVKKEECSFFRIVVWGKIAEVCNQYLDKGKQVAVHGHLRQSRWENNEGQTRSKIEIVAKDIQFLGSPQNNKPEPVNEPEPDFTNTVFPENDDGITFDYPEPEKNLFNTSDEIIE